MSVKYLRTGRGTVRIGRKGTPHFFRGLKPAFSRHAKTPKPVENMPGPRAVNRLLGDRPSRSGGGDHCDIFCASNNKNGTGSTVPARRLDTRRRATLCQLNLNVRNATNRSACRMKPGASRHAVPIAARFSRSPGLPRRSGTRRITGSSPPLRRQRIFDQSPKRAATLIPTRLRRSLKPVQIQYFRGPVPRHIIEAKKLGPAMALIALAVMTLALMSFGVVIQVIAVVGFGEQAHDLPFT